jgi:hypothetical protein
VFHKLFPSRARQEAVCAGVPFPSPTKSGTGKLPRSHGGASLGHATHQLSSVGALDRHAYDEWTIDFVIGGVFGSAIPLKTASPSATGKRK